MVTAICVSYKYEHNKPLSTLFVTQRHQYMLLCKGKPSLLTADRIAILEKIGFGWNWFYHSQWDIRYDEHIAFKQENGCCNAP